MVTWYSLTWMFIMLIVGIALGAGGFYLMKRPDMLSLREKMTRITNRMIKAEGGLQSLVSVLVKGGLAVCAECGGRGEVEDEHCRWCGTKLGTPEPSNIQKEFAGMKDKERAQVIEDARAEAYSVHDVHCADCDPDGNVHHSGEGFCTRCGKSLVPKPKFTVFVLGKCDKCDTQNEADAEHCKKCGAPMPKPPDPRGFCPDCKTQNDVDAKHCKKCGHPLKAPTQVLAGVA